MLVDLATVFGLVLSFGALAVSVNLEGGSLRAMVNLPAALIVFGGSLGAALVSLPLGVSLKSIVVFRHVLFSKPQDPVATIRLLGDLARVARREGVLALEGELLRIQDPFLRRGIQLVVDGTDPEVTESILETELEAQNERHQMGARFFMTMGGLAPTLGVTGTVMGLVNMLGKLDDPSTMGPAIATAFLATLYGVGSANLIFLPAATKLKVRSSQEQFVRRMTLLGIQGLQAGDSPIVLAERLKAFLSPRDRSAADEAEDSLGSGVGESVGAEA